MATTQLQERQHTEYENTRSRSHYAHQPCINHSLRNFSVAEPEYNWSNHRNGQYSIVAVTDDNGAILERYSYTAFGDPAFFDGSGSVVSNSQVSNRFTYTGREYDPTIRLYHYRARMYDPQLGRFLGRDTIGFESGQWNLYASGVVLLQLDPSGTQTTNISEDERVDLRGCGCQAYKVKKLPPNAGGRVECEDGEFVPKLKNPKSHPQEDCHSKCGAFDCEMEHEEHHIDQFKDICPTACQSIPCGVSRDGWVMGFTGGKDSVNKSECYAYRVQLDCSKAKYEKEKQKRPADRTFCSFKTSQGVVSRSCLIYLRDEHRSTRKRVLKEFDPENPYAGQCGCIRDYDIRIDPIQ